VRVSGFAWFSVCAVLELTIILYSETCGTPLGRAKSVPNSEVYSFQAAICTENRSLGPA
jgi:hypothetical protein